MVYSGIVDIVKGAGQIYGELAYETLSILFIVCLPRRSHEVEVLRLLGYGQQEWQ